MATPTKDHVPGIEATHVPFGEITGYSPTGVAAYSNFSDYHFSGERNFDGKIFTGFRWQCVEYARRWLLEQKGILLPDIPWAVHIFGLPSMERVDTGEPVECVSIRNGTKEPPVADSLLIYPSDEGGIVGHVAAMTEVGDGYVRICDQNLRFHNWGDKTYSAELVVVKDSDGNYHIQDRDPEAPDTITEPLGWVTFPSVPNRDRSTPLVFHPKFHDPTYPDPEFGVSYVPDTTPATPDWFDRMTTAGEAFAKADGPQWPTAGPGARYFTLNIEAMFGVVASTNQIHKVFRRAVEQALSIPDAAARFGVPSEVWPAVCHSFQSGQLGLVARYSFAFGGVALKCIGANADSLEGLYECGVAQLEWAAAAKIEERSRSSGHRIRELLVAGWKQQQLPKRALVHFLIGSDVPSAAVELVRLGALDAALRTKVVTTANLTWNGKSLVDRDGEVVEAIFKAPSWAEVFSDFEATRDSRPEGLGMPGGEPLTLSDVLIRSGVRCIEPLWRHLLGHRSILPILSQQAHSAILNASSELSPALRQTGYVVKAVDKSHEPRLLSAVDASGAEVYSCSVATSSESKALKSIPKVYQERAELAVFGAGESQERAVVHGYMVGEHFGGMLMRCDPSQDVGGGAATGCTRINVDYNPAPVTAASIDSKEEESSK